MTIESSRKNIPSIAILFFIFLFVGCDIKRPGIDSANYSSLIFNHKDITDNCISCHESTRPTPVPAPTWAPTTEFSHYNNQDCNSCHTAGGNWTSHSFDHKPTPLSCYQCHESDRPAPVSSLAHGAQADCKSCHAINSTWTSSITTYTHPDSLTSCVLCHEKDRPLTFVKNGIAQVHNSASDCVACHKPAGWIPAAAFDHTPITAACSSCHGAGMTYDKTTTTMHNGMTHPTTGECSTCHVTSGFTPATSFSSHTGVTSNCSSCHTTVGVYISLTKDALPSKMSLANNEAHPTSASGDCSICHTYITGNEFKGHATDYKHEPRPATCISCHEAGSTVVVTSGSLKQTRPTSHTTSTDIVKKTGDCISCHTSTSSWSMSGGDIAAAHATYLTNNTSCNSCHANGQTSPKQKPTQFSVDGSITGKKVSHDSTNECKDCHSFSNGWYLATKYGHDYDSTAVSCQDCHAGSGIALAKDKVPANGLIRSTATVPHPNLISCGSCHYYNGYNVGWVGRATDYNHGPTAPSTCNLCHDSQVITTSSNETKRPSNMSLNFSISMAHPTNTACNTCHTMPPAGHAIPMNAANYSWMPATSFTHSLLTTPSRSTTTPTRHCITCHENGNYVSKAVNKRPTSMGSNAITNSSASGHYNLSTDATAPTDCYACHSSSSWSFSTSTHKSNIQKMSGYSGSTFKSQYSKGNCTTSCH
jgi:hypothetical protein